MTRARHPGSCPLFLLRALVACAPVAGDPSRGEDTVANSVTLIVPFAVNHPSYFVRVHVHKRVLPYARADNVLGAGLWLCRSTLAGDKHKLDTVK